MMIVNNGIINNNIEVSNKNNIFIDELMKIYKSEKILNETLPIMILEASSQEIINAYTKHLKFTQEHILRLETFFKSINQPIK